MKVMSIFGTRPEMIKLWSTLRKLDELNFEHVMVHTGQNFTPELKDFFFRDLELRENGFAFEADRNLVTAGRTIDRALTALSELARSQ